ncbi:hypothetical protein BY996DRAFT_8688718 [Phakopsora pachyrhizi]|nr:hypothetical protein BY996DRAFT_8688718 [Phakopsora pachyrhizi]
MANQSISSVVGLEVENPIFLLTPDRDVSLENLDPDLEQYSSIQKVIVEYSVYIPSNGGIQATSAQFGKKSNAIQPCIHFCNKGSCYKTDLPISSIGWNQFQFLLYKSTNNSEARFHELIRNLKDVFITGYVSNDPEL